MNGEDPQQAPPQVEQQAVTIGAAIPGTTTIDAVFTAIFGTKSAALTPNTYRYSDWNAVQCYYPDNSIIVARFEARAFAPNSIKP